MSGDSIHVTLMSGELIDLLNPKEELINIEEIACSLSRIPRFNGMTKKEHEFGYSVAQHSVYVCELLRKASVNDEDKYRSLLLSCAGLLHDAHEAYEGDNISPIKNNWRFTTGYYEIEQALDPVIYNKLLPAYIHITEGEWKLLKHFDHQAAVDEAYWCVAGEGISRRGNLVPQTDLELIPLAPKQAERLFLDTYYELRQSMQTIEDQAWTL